MNKRKNPELWFVITFLILVILSLWGAAWLSFEQAAKNQESQKLLLALTAGGIIEVLASTPFLYLLIGKVWGKRI